MSNEFDELENKIRAARGQSPKSANAEGEAGPEKAGDNSMRNGMEAGMEFVAAIAVGLGIGFGLDSWLNTKPAFIILFFFIGMITGFYNIYRLMKKLERGGGDSALRREKKPAKKPAEEQD